MSKSLDLRSENVHTTTSSPLALYPVVPCGNISAHPKSLVCVIFSDCAYPMLLTSEMHTISNNVSSVVRGFSSVCTHSCPLVLSSGSSMCVCVQVYPEQLLISAKRVYVAASTPWKQQQSKFAQIQCWQRSMRTANHTNVD